MDERSKFHWFWSAVALVGVVTAWPGPGKNIVAGFIGGTIGLGVLYLSVHRVRHATSAAMTIVGAFAAIFVAFCALAALTDHQQKATDNNLKQFGSAKQPIGLAWNALDQAPAGSRVACFMNKNYDILPLYGRRYQFDAVAVDSNGAVSLPLHERFRNDPTFSMSQSKAAVPKDAAGLIDNLRESRIDYILVSKWPGDNWPPQHSILAKSDKLRVFYEDDYSVIWQFPSAK